MKTRAITPTTVITAMSLVLAGTSCAAPRTPVPVTDQDPAQWSADVLPPAPAGGFTLAGTVAEAPSSGVAHDVEPGWYEVSATCTGTEHVSLELRDENTHYGSGYIPCTDSPITILSYLGDNPYVPAEDVSVDVSVDVSQTSAPALWGLTASPTDAPS